MCPEILPVVPGFCCSVWPLAPFNATPSPLLLRENEMFNSSVKANSEQRATRSKPLLASNTTRTQPNLPFPTCCCCFRAGAHGKPSTSPAETFPDTHLACSFRSAPTLGTSGDSIRSTWWRSPLSEPHLPWGAAAAAVPTRPWQRLTDARHGAASTHGESPAPRRHATLLGLIGGSLPPEGD